MRSRELSTHDERSCFFPSQDPHGHSSGSPKQNSASHTHTATIKTPPHTHTLTSPPSPLSHTWRSVCQMITQSLLVCHHGSLVTTHTHTHARRPWWGYMGEHKHGYTPPHNGVQTLTLSGTPWPPAPGPQPVCADIWALIILAFLFGFFLCWFAASEKPTWLGLKVQNQIIEIFNRSSYHSAAASFLFHRQKPYLHY